MEFYPISLPTERKLPSLQEREFVKLPKPTAAKTGFTPRPMEKIVHQKPSPTPLTMECLHRIRIQENVPYSYYPSVEHRLWREAGKLSPPFPQRPDDNYDFNVWRNFKSAFGLTLPPNNKNYKEDEMMAVYYPVNIPKPSHMKDSTFAKYLETSNTFKDDAKRKAMTKLVLEEEKIMKKAATLSSARNPPLDKRGNILPPKGYRRYAHAMLMPMEEIQPESEITPDMEPDMFGNLVRKKPRKNLWKLTLKSNNPNYKEAQDFARTLNNSSKQHLLTFASTENSKPRIVERVE